MHNRLLELFGEQWYEILRPFLLSNEFKHIASTLKKMKDNNVIVTPDFKNMFRAFKECPYDELTGVIIGMDPYPGVNRDGSLIADGIAFSSNTAPRCPKSLAYIYDAITDMNKGDMSHVGTYDLTKWSNQGILMLNTSLSTVVGKSGVHLELWRPFIKYVLEYINKDKDYLGVILLGAEAKKTRQYFTKVNHDIIAAQHPAAAAYNGGIWDHNNVFPYFEAQQAFYGKEIKW